MWRWWVAGWLCLMCVRASAAPHRPAARDVPSYILVDAEGAAVLEEHEADTHLPAGSASQLMLLLLSLEEAQLGALPIDVAVTIGALAVPGDVGGGTSGARRVLAGARLIPLQQDEAYLLSDLLKALAVTGADDAAVAVAEAIAGSVPACIELMNARAQRLGLESTHFARIGWVPVKSFAAELDTTTARSMARLARALVRRNVVLQWSSLPGLPFHGGAVLLRNVNSLVGKIAGVDGLQVSSTEDGRYGIVATAERDGLRLIAVVLDAVTSEERYRVAAELLERGFSQYERVALVKQGDRMNFPVPVRDGSQPHITPVAGGAFTLLRRRGEEPHLELYYQVPSAVAAPLRRDQMIGELVVKEGSELRAVIPLLSPANVASGGALAAARR
jgi:D-alanyl-D-alanine carboxypeptidase (penicillin-binding protein 5/6)